MNKKHLLLILIFVTSVSVSYSQWEEQNSGVNFAIRDICFVDSLYGWCVGEGKEIIATTNGGENWTTICTLKDTVELKYVQFIDRNVGFIGGNIVIILPGYEVRQAIIMSTGDGGFTWESISASFDTCFTFGSARFLNGDTGWVSMYNIVQALKSRGILLKTTDGGNSWVILKEDNIFSIGAFAFSDVDHGYSFWGPFFDNFDPTFVFKTTDGGINWFEVGTIQSAQIGMAKSINPDKLLAISMGNLWLSCDAGNNWEVCNLPEGQMGFFPTNMGMLDSNNVYLVGGVNGQPDLGRLYITNNAGKNWIIDFELQNNLFLSIALVNKKKAWIGGLDGVIMHTDNILTNIIPENNSNPEVYNLEQNYPNPFNPTTTIKYTIPEDGIVTIKVFDVLGREIEMLVNQRQLKGDYSVKFDASGLSSGMYIYQIRMNDFMQSKKMVLLH